MSREETEEYEQDRFGNSRRKIDKLRAREGSVGGSGTEGILDIGSADTGTTLGIFKAPRHASQVVVEQIRGYASVVSGGDTLTLFEVELDSNGSVTSSTKRSVPLSMVQSTTTTYEYHGEPFENSVGVSAEFEGEVSVGVYSDHHEEDEPSVEVTKTP